MQQSQRARSGLPDPAPDASTSARRPIWWRWLGLATILVAAFTANTVWKINRHVSRMELARIFAQAMTAPRPPRLPPPVIQERPVYAIRRSVPKPNATATAPFSLDPSNWIHPADDPETNRPRPRPALPPPRPQPTSPQRTRHAPIEDGLTPQAGSSRKTQISEVTRQTWALLSLVILECVALAGLSGVLDARRARRNLIAAACLLMLGTGLAVSAALIVIHWGGYPPLAWRDYLQIALRGGGPAVGLLVILMLPHSRRYSQALRQQLATGRSIPRLARPGICGLLCIGTAGACAAAAGLGSYWSLPVWHVVRWVLIGWSLPAALLGVLAWTGRRGILAAAYVSGLIGLTLHLACWGLPFATIGPPAALRALLVLLPAHLIVLGRLRACLAAKTTPAQAQR